MRTSLSPVQYALPERNVVTMFFVVTIHKFNDSIHVSGTTTNSRWYDFFFIETRKTETMSLTLRFYLHFNFNLNSFLNG